MFRASTWLIAALIVGAAPRARAQDQHPRSPTPQELKRQKLLEGMGLEKKESPPAAVAPTRDVPRPDTPPSRAPSLDPPGAMSSSPVSNGPHAPVAAPSFARAIHPMLMQTCRPCHSSAGPAASTRLVLSGELSSDHAAILRVVDARNAPASPLLAKASGQMHAGGAPWPADSAAAGRVLAWIKGGAPLDAAPAQPKEEVSTASTSSRAQRPPAQLTAPPPPLASETANEPSTPPTPVLVIPEVSSGIHPLLMEACGVCHGPAGLAAATRFVLRRDVDADLASARSLIDLTAPERSLLVTKSGGEMHAGGAPLPRGSVRQQRLLTWIRQGAPGPVGTRGTPAPPAAGPAPPMVVGSVVPAPDASPVAVAAPPAPRHPGLGRGALALPYGFALNGRFDVAYERRQFSGQPWNSGAVDALRSYHHFLFLSHESAEDRVGLSVEVLSLLFWEVHLRVNPAGDRRPWHLTVAAGKILVPFGAEPLYHQSYGGLAGFDQPILPAIWSQEGLAAHLVVQRRQLAITDDLYVVRGYALRQGDAVLNLQSDFSPEDQARPGWGNRVGLAWGPLSAWYSTYYNQLGFGRRLFMQAGDVMLWRLRGVAVLSHFSFAAGMVHADVSGGGAQGFGGPGKDYYHFGSYVQLRYHPCEWLFVQYRQGLRTFNNRRGLFVDDTRLTSEDGSTHNFGVVARQGGLSAGIFYFVNLEKVAETANDLLRLSLTYEL